MAENVVEEVELRQLRLRRSADTCPCGLADKQLGFEVLGSHSEYKQGRVWIYLPFKRIDWCVESQLQGASWKQETFPGLVQSSSSR